MFSTRYLEIEKVCRKFAKTLDKLELTSADMGQYNFFDDHILTRYWYKEIYDKKI